MLCHCGQPFISHGGEYATLMLDRPWRGGAQIGVLYRVMTDADCARVGLCWMKGRLRIGDYALCLEHAGDCFYEYMLIERIANGWRGYPQATFGAYVFGETFPECHLSSREYHLLAAGEFIQRNDWLHFPENRVLTQGEAP